jgi:hypothetical protein
MFSIGADRFASQVTCFASLFGRELMGCPFAMRSSTTLASNSALLFSIHRGKATFS